MRDFSWNFFAVTGDIEAYLLFKQVQSLDDGVRRHEEEEQQAELESVVALD